MRALELIPLHVGHATSFVTCVVYRSHSYNVSHVSHADMGSNTFEFESI